MTVITRRTTTSPQPDPASPSPAATEAGSTRKTGKGMPARTPPPHTAASLVDKTLTPQDTAAQAHLALPHERDQSVQMTAQKPGKKMRQASVDVQRGIQDTSKSVEMNQAYKKLK